MKPLQPPESLAQDSDRNDFGEGDAPLLEQVVERLVRFGQQVGVTLPALRLVAAQGGPLVL